MKQKEDRLPLQVEFEEWEKAQSSGAILALYKILKKHQIWCENRALGAIRNKKPDDAMCYEARARGMTTLIDSIQARIKDVRKSLGKEE